MIAMIIIVLLVVILTTEGMRELGFSSTKFCEIEGKKHS